MGQRVFDRGSGRESHGTRTSDSDCGNDTTGGNTVCGRATKRSWVNEIPLCLTSNSEAHPHGESLEPPRFFGHRLQSSMTRATVEDSAAGLGQALCVGYPSMTSRDCACVHWHEDGQEEVKPRAWSLALGVGYPPQTPWVALGAVNSEDPTECTAKQTIVFLVPDVSIGPHLSFSDLKRRNKRASTPLHLTTPSQYNHSTH